ncbi:hypothetical protein BK011_06805 [Tenericutes bacterium MZ-XQ]|nr:hypothetical protein BK011_06805 [Tenericutes bacterium MZ-XQ]
MDLTLSIINLVITLGIAVSQFFLYKKVNDYETINKTKSENSKILFSKKLTVYEGVVSIIRKIEHCQALVISYQTEIQQSSELPTLVSDKLSEINKLSNELDAFIWDHIIYFPEELIEKCLAYRTIINFFTESIHFKYKYNKKMKISEMLEKYIHVGNNINPKILKIIEVTFDYHEDEDDPEYVYQFSYLSRSMYDLTSDITEDINLFIADNTL